jgi:hypothetical protein
VVVAVSLMISLAVPSIYYISKVGDCLLTGETKNSAHSISFSVSDDVSVKTQQTFICKVRIATSQFQQSITKE